MSLESDYRSRFEHVLTPLAQGLQRHIEGLLDDVPRIDRLATRPKGVNSFLKKAAKQVRNGPKYANPLVDIQDQIGARIITFYKDDADAVAEIVLKYLRPIEDKDKTPESEWEFGYFGRHLIMFIPNDVINPEIQNDDIPHVFELQIKRYFNTPGPKLTMI